MTGPIMISEVGDPAEVTGDVSAAAGRLLRQLRSAATAPILPELKASSRS